jgi:hypothetical protein
MSYVRGEDRGQAALPFAAIEDYVAAPVRVRLTAERRACRTIVRYSQGDGTMFSRSAFIYQ